MVKFKNHRHLPLNQESKKPNAHNISAGRGEKLAKKGTTGKGSRTISNGELLAINSAKTLHRRIINSTLRGITDIRVLIHRSVFSGTYSLGTLQKMLQFGVKADDSFEEYGRYSFKRNIQLNTGKLKLHFKFPDQGYGPSCLITTNKSTYDHLSNIYNRLRELKITRLEYAVDLFCRDPDAVTDLLWLIRRYLYAPNAFQTSMVGGEFFGYQDYARLKNAVYYIWKGKSTGKHIKAYERGPDSKRISGTQTWDHNDVDRVRIEFKLKRIAIAHKYGLSTLKQLLMNPQAASIASEYVQFKNFKFSRKLPQDWEDYLSKDENGNTESFIQEVLSAKDSNVKNIIQYIEDNKTMDGLKRRIIEAAEHFDKNLSKGCRLITK